MCIRDRLTNGASYITSAGNTWRGIDDTPVNGQTSESITSNWAYDHAASSTAHPRDTRNQAAGSYLTLTGGTIVGDLIVEKGTTNTAKFKLNVQNAGSPQLEFSDNGGDMSWALGGDDGDNSFKIHGNANATMPIIDSLAIPHFELTPDGLLTINSSSSSAGITVNLSGTTGQAFTGLKESLASGGQVSLIVGKNRLTDESAVFRYMHNTTAASRYVGIGFYNHNDLLKVYQTGDVISTGDMTAFSDRKLKDNIKLIENPLDKVLQLEGVTYNRIDKEDKERVHIGFIAQDVEKVLPELVSSHKDQNGEDTKSVNYQQVTAVLAEAIKEQEEKICEQSEEINDLNERLDSQQEVINAQNKMLQDLMERMNKLENK